MMTKILDNSGVVGSSKMLHLLIHIIGWGIIFCFPFFFFQKDNHQMTWLSYLGYVFVPVGFMVVFYMNYFLLIDRVLFRRQLLRFVLLNVLLTGVVWFCLDLWRDYYFTQLSVAAPKAGPHPPKLMFFLRDLMLMGLTAALSVAIKMTDRWYIVEQEKKELQKARTEAELQNLKNQLNPHFLFNTLNNIYALIAINQERAQYAVHDLSKLLRYVLYENDEKRVPFHHELAFMKSYIELMSLRLSSKVDLRVDLPAEGGSLMVAPLLFITLVENAFKHGVSAGEKSFVHIRFTVKEGESVACRVENSYFPKRDTDCSGSGIGLDNLHRRLELLYPGHYRLDTGLQAGIYVAELVLVPEFCIVHNV